MRSSLPVLTFQRKTDSLPAPLASNCPLGEKAIDVTVSSRFSKVSVALPDPSSHRIKFRSSPPLASIRPSGLKASALTTSRCFFNSIFNAPVSTLLPLHYFTLSSRHVAFDRSNCYELTIGRKRNRGRIPVKLSD